jgi:hypothetical protein
VIRLHYAKARQHAFPYGVKRVAGPFETAPEAWDAVKRLRPLYPDCEVFSEVDNVSNAKGALALGGEPIKERVA